MSVSANLLNAFLLTIVLIICFGRLADRVGLVDVPTLRKLHAGKIPLIGGVAMFLGFFVAALMLGDVWYPHWNFVVGLFILVCCGSLDDMLDLRASTKLAVQILAALVMILPGWNVVAHVGGLFGLEGNALGSLTLPFTILMVVGMINAFNMADGLDGLAGGLAVFAFAWLALAAGLSAMTGDLVLILLLMVSTLGFLIFNMRGPWRDSASIFMGDAGSMMLGASIAYFIISLGQVPGRPPSLAALLWVVAIPVIDTLSLIVRRLRAGHNPLAADRRHLHHLLLDAGLSPRRATACILLASALLGGIGIAGMIFAVPEPLLLLGLLLPLAIHGLIVFYASPRPVRDGAGEAASALISLSSVGEPNP